MRILVTGASGFIGRQTLDPLLKRGFEVHAVYSKKHADLDARVLWHRCDLLQSNTAKELCGTIKPSHLLHFAWYVNPIDYKTSPENDRWIPATLSLLRAFKESGGTRAVLTGTCMEYDWNTGKQFLREDSPIASVCPYSRAKNEARRAALEYATRTGLSLAWGRIFNLYGPYEDSERLVSQVIAAVSRNQPPRVLCGVTLDYSYVADIAEAFAALVDSEVKGVVNIASGKAITLEEMANTAADMLNRSDLRAVLLASDEAPKRVVADVTRLTEEVGWRPRYPLHDGLRDMIDWWRQNQTKATNGSPRP